MLFFDKCTYFRQVIRRDRPSIANGGGNKFNTCAQGNFIEIQKQVDCSYFGIFSSISSKTLEQHRRTVDWKHKTPCITANMDNVHMYNVHLANGPLVKA